MDTVLQLDCFIVVDSKLSLIELIFTILSVGAWLMSSTDTAAAWMETFSLTNLVGTCADQGNPSCNSFMSPLPCYVCMKLWKKVVVERGC